MAAPLAINVQKVLTKEVKDMQTPGGAFCGSWAVWPEVFHMLVCIGEGGDRQAPKSG